MNNVKEKIKRYVEDILLKDASGYLLHIILKDAKVDDASIKFCLSELEGKNNMLDIMCKHCAQLLLSIPEEERFDVIDLSERYSEYSFCIGDQVFSEYYNSYGTVSSINDDGSIEVVLEITDTSKEVAFYNILKENVGSAYVSKNEIYLL